MTGETDYRAAVRGRRDAHPAQLWGRDGEMGIIRAVVEHAARGRFDGAVVTGEAGIGKTRLISDLAEEASARGVRTFAGRCAELDRFRPFVPLAAALGCAPDAQDPRRAAVARALRAGQADVSPTTAGFGPIESQVIDVIVQLVEALAVDGTLLLILDDLHWADRSTLAGIRAITTELADLPVAFVGTTRPHPQNPDLEALIQSMADRPLTELALGALPPDTVAGMAAEVLGRPPSAGLLRELERASGNPFFVLELIAALREQGMEDVESSDGAGVGVTPSVRLTVLRRIGLLQPSAVALVRRASVLGSAFTVGDLASATGETTSALAPDLEIAARAGVLVEDGRELRFRHDLVREALYLDIPEPLRVAQHLEFGRRLAGGGADPERVAAHFVLGASKGDVEAAEYIQRAARTIAPGAPGVAAELLDRALDLVDGPSELHDTIEADLALLSLWSGDAAGCERHARAVLARRPSDDVGIAARRALIESLFFTIRWAEGADEAARGLASEDLPRRHRGQLLCFFAHGLLYSGNDAAAGPAAAEAAQIARELGDDLMAGYAVWVQGEHALATGDLQAAKGYAVEALDASRRATNTPAGDAGGPWAAAVAGAHHDVGTALLQLGGLASMSMDLDGARSHVEEAIAHFEQIGSVAYGAFAFAALGGVQYLAADFDSAELALSECQRVRESCALPALAQVATLLVLVHLHRGDLVAARQELSRVEPSRPAFGWIRILIAAADGDPNLPAVIQRATEAHSFDEFDAGTDPWWWDIELLHAAVIARQQGVADAIVDGLERRAHEYGTGWTAGYALHAKGLRDGDVDLLVEATAALRGSDLLAAHAAEDAGAASVAAGDFARARPLLMQAAEVYERAAASARLRRVLASMRSAGLRPTVRSAPRRPTVGWEALTDAERGVVALAAEGLTNPEIGARLFISRRTVQTHLSHVFAKLGISSRVELATAAAARDASFGATPEA